MDALEFFRVAYAAEPIAVWTAAGSRSVVLGHHSNYCAGFALTCAFAPRVTCVASPRADHRLVIRTVALPAVEVDVDLDSVVRNEYGAWTDGLDDLGLGRWPRQVLCAPAILRAAGVFAGGANLVIDRDLPIGTDTYEFESPITSVAMGVYVNLYGFEAALAPKRQAELAAQGEGEFLFSGAGEIDHLTSLFGQPGSALLLDWGRAEGVVAPYAWSPEYVPLDLAGAGLALTVVRGLRPAHDSLYEGNVEWRELCRRQATKLGRERLRDFTAEEFAALAQHLGFEDTRVSMHTFAENARVEQAAARLRADEDPRFLGPMLTASHMSLRDDLGIGRAEVETVVTAALMAGALGARMSGDEMATWVLVLTEAGATERVQLAIERAFAAEPGLSGSVWFEPAIPSAGLAMAYT